MIHVAALIRLAPRSAPRRALSRPPAGRRLQFRPSRTATWRTWRQNAAPSSRSRASTAPARARRSAVSRRILDGARSSRRHARASRARRALGRELRRLVLGPELALDAGGRAAALPRRPRRARRDGDRAGARRRHDRALRPLLRLDDRVSRLRPRARPRARAPLGRRRAARGVAPDLTLLLDCPVDARRRAPPSRRRTAISRSTRAFHARVRDGFLAAGGRRARAHPSHRREPRPRRGERGGRARDRSTHGSTQRDSPIAPRRAPDERARRDARRRPAPRPLARFADVRGHDRADRVSPPRMGAEPSRARVRLHRPRGRRQARRCRALALGLHCDARAVRRVRRLRRVPHHRRRHASRRPRHRRTASRSGATSRSSRCASCSASSASARCRAHPKVGIIDDARSA